MKGRISVESIEQMLARLRESEQPLFYIGRMYCNIKLHVHDFLPKYEIITCYDPFHGRFPFLKVPESINAGKEPHRCEDTDLCLLDLLRDPEVIKYMKSRGKNPKACLVCSNAECQKICKENGIQVWGPSSEIFEYLGNKVKIVEVLKDVGIPFIPNVLSPINSYHHLQDISKCLGTGKIVIQAQDGSSGYGTYFINSQEDYLNYSKEIEDGNQKKIMPFRRLRSFGIGAVTGSFGTALGPLHSQLIGHEKLTPFHGGFCGNQIRKDYFDDQQTQKKVRSEIYLYAERFGDYIYKKGMYRGHFGLDFVVDMDSFQVFLMEVNPRQSASATLSHQYYQADGYKFPLFLYSCAEWLGFQLRFSVKQFNRQWQETRLYEPSGCHIAFKYMNKEELDINTTAPMGIWILQQGQLKFTGRFSYLVQELKQEEIFFLPSKGFAKAHIILRCNCQQSTSKLNQSTELLITKFLSLIHASILP